MTWGLASISDPLGVQGPSEMELWIRERSDVPLHLLVSQRQAGAAVAAWKREQERRKQANEQAMAKQAAARLLPNPTGPLHFRRHFKLD